MKTAISINDDLLQEADKTARLMGVSRSRLFARRLNDVYSGTPDPREKHLLKAIKATVRPVVKDRW